MTAISKRPLVRLALWLIKFDARLAGASVTTTTYDAREND